VPFFDETRVPVETIELAAPQAAGSHPMSSKSSATRTATGSRSARAATWCSSTAGR